MTVRTKRECGTAFRLLLATLLGASACASTPGVTDKEPPAKSVKPQSDAAPQSSQDAGGFDECASVAISANLIPANLLFVLDRSGSMNCVAPDGDEKEAALCKTDPRKRGDSPSKWEITRQALVEALTHLGARENVKLGFSLFPSTGTQCDVEATPEIELHGTGDAFLESTDSVLRAVVPDGETPIAGSTILGYAHLAEQLKQRQIFGNTYLVLLTDGNETCKPSELEKLVDNDVPLALSAFGIRTFVVGAPGSEGARALLSKIAFQGGTATSDTCDHGDDSETADCHFDMTRSLSFSTDLGKVLTDIAQSRALSCEFQVPRDPAGGSVNLNQVNVTLTSVQEEISLAIGKDPGAVGSCKGKVDGWTYSADFQKILLCGESCEAARASSDGRVEIILGCATRFQPQIF